MWWRKRPSVHVAEARTMVVDMGDHITMLDVNTSQFVAMLKSLPSRQASLHWLEDELFPRLTPQWVRAGEWIAWDEVSWG